MINNLSTIIFDNQSIHYIFDQYQIQLNYYLDSINIQIQNNSNIYESKFNLEYLNTLLVSNYSMDEMVNCVNEIINKKNIKIKENRNNLRLNLISKNKNVELIIDKKNILSNEIIEKIVNEIKEIKNENIKLRNRIELIENKNDLLNKRIELIENNNNELKIKIKTLEGYHKNKKKIKLTKSNLQNINSIQPHNSYINSIKSFPSGNIISVSNDQSIKIFDIHLNLIQSIENAHYSFINCVEIKDENNFITCSSDKSIKLWINKENKFQINKIINNAHDDAIIEIIYCSNGNLISCSYDNKIKIWKENNNNNYDIIQILKHSKYVYSILFLEDKNILISSGLDGTKFWDLNEININCIKYFENTFSGWNGSLCRLDENSIIVQGNTINSLKVISILNLKIIKEFNNPFRCNGIYLIENKGIFIIGGRSNDIRIYRNDNFECIQTIENAHYNDIKGFVELKDGSIASFSKDKTIKIWCF